MTTTSDAPKTEPSESQNLHLTQLAYVVAGGIITFTIPQSRVWYLYFSFVYIGLLIASASAIELIVARLRMRTAPTFSTVSLLGGLALIPVGALIRSPLLLPDDGKVRIAVMTFSPGEAGEHFTDRLVLTLKKAQDAGLPIEIVEVGATTIGSTEQEQEIFASRAGRALPVSAHLVIWGRVVTDVPPFYTTANITLANNLFAREGHGYRDAPWLEIASLEGRHHPRYWSRTVFQTDSAPTLEALLPRQTTYLNELVAFVSGLVLLESKQYERVRTSLPSTPASFNLRYLRAVASVEASVEAMVSWLDTNADFFLHAPPPPKVRQPLLDAIEELSGLLSSTGSGSATTAQGLTWYAHYTRARAKQMELHLRMFATPEELTELRDLYEDLRQSAIRDGDKIGEARAFVEAGRYHLQLADSATRSRVVDSLYAGLQSLLSDRTLPPEIQATLHLRQGGLCAHSERLPRYCAASAYESALRLFRSLDLPVAEADVHRALGDYYRVQRTRPAFALAARHYSSALQIHSQSKYANIGTRAGDAWWYLRALEEYHNGRIPNSEIAGTYQFVVDNVFGATPIRVRGVGDLFLQKALTQLKLRECEEIRPERECWQSIRRHTDAILLNQPIALDEPQVALYLAIRARASWEVTRQGHTGLGSSSQGTYEDFLGAISNNNAAGGNPEALVQIWKLYQQMLFSARDPHALDAQIMAMVRSECGTKGFSRLITNGDTLATRLHVALPGSSKQSANRCAKTSLVSGFVPLELVIPQVSVAPPSLRGSSHATEP